jgi:predicted phage terminase large subunit-like protein
MLASQQHYLEKLARELFKNGYSEDKVIDVLIREKNNFKIFKPQFSFKDFVIPLQKELEPKWSYEEDFFQYVINDYSHFLDKRRSDLFLLEAPPRTGKTELVTGFGIPYLLATQSNKRILVICGNQALKRKLRKVVVRVVKSDYYKKNYKKYLTINNSSEIQTNDGNIVQFTTTSSEVPTGEGYHYIFLEDPLTHTMIRSEAKREDAFEQIDGCLTRTQDDPATQVILNSQRLNCEDFNQRIANRYNEACQSITRLTMPYYFKEDVIIKDAFDNQYNFKEGQFLIPRFDQDKKDKIVAKIGINAFETQYQQNPIDSQDILIKNEWWRHYTCEPLDLDLKNIFITCDLALTEKTTSDYSVICAWGVDSENKLYLLDGMRTKARYNEIKQVFISFYQKWNYNKYANRNYIKASQFFIEDVSVSKPLIDDLRNVISIIKPIPRNTSKTARMEASSTTIANGFVFLPKNLPFAQELVDEAYHFRADNSHRHDDIVDNLCDAIEHGLSRATKNTDFTKINSALSRYYNT